MLCIDPQNCLDLRRQKHYINKTRVKSKYNFWAYAKWHEKYNNRTLGLAPFQLCFPFFLLKLLFKKERGRIGTDVHPIWIVIVSQYLMLLLMKLLFNNLCWVFTNRSFFLVDNGQNLVSETFTFLCYDYNGLVDISSIVHRIVQEKRKNSRL